MDDTPTKNSTVTIRIAIELIGNCRCRTTCDDDSEDAIIRTKMDAGVVDIVVDYVVDAFVIIDFDVDCLVVVIIL